MRINTKQILIDLFKKPLLVEGKELTVGVAIASILLAPRQNKTFDMLKSYILSGKFFNDKEVDLDEADLKKLKETIELGDTYSPLISGQLIQLLEKNEKVN